MDLPVLRVGRADGLSAPLKGAGKILDDQPAALPQRPYQPDHDIATLRQMAQHQPGMDQIVAGRRDLISGDVMMDNLELAQLGGRDEPGIDVGGGDASGWPDSLGQPPGNTA